MMHEITMPDLGQTTSEGKILKWLKKPGDKVSRGEFLLEVETDKVTMEVESCVSGYLRAILAGEGQMASAMSPIAIVTEGPDEPFEHPGQEVSRQVLPVSPVPGSLTVANEAGRPILVAPAARSLAKELRVDVKAVSGTGPGGLITRKDVEQFAAGRTASKAEAAMAALATRSKQTIPHFYLTVDVDVAAAERWREDWNKAHPDLQASLNDVFVRAASKALRDVPAINVRYREGRVEQMPAADVILVVAIESGLVLVPVSDPGSLTWEECLRTLRDTVERAKRGRVAELHSTVSPVLAISNLGMFRVRQFAAIIPPLSTSALAVGTARDVPVVCDQQVRVGRVSTLTLSADHRIIDGIKAAGFMERIQEHLNAL
jgi:pyruvate dehydrogenase E2 component (dihydrolipoamide acetyltransferase)